MLMRLARRHAKSVAQVAQAQLEMATGRDARGPGRAGPENPGPRASRAQTGLKLFLFKSPLCNGKFKFLLMFYKFY